MPCHSASLARVAVSILALTGRAVGQFGGGGDYTPPAPICPAFSCPKGQKAAPKVDHQVWSYGCKDSGMNVFNMAGGMDFDPITGMPRQGANQKNVNKCCVEKDICRQTCGMTSKACHDAFQKCSKKICKGDQNCNLQAMMADIMSTPYEPDDLDEGETKKYDPEATKCREYNRGQAAACTCVPKDTFKSATEDKLKSFYKAYNPEKLDESGEIKDSEEVWSKWSGKESELIMALTTKYKAKAVEMRQKPKPGEKPGDGPAAKKKKQENLDVDDEAFEAEVGKLLSKKRKAADDEDYDLAEKVKEQVDELKAEEAKRLEASKAKAVEAEDFKEAKRVKQRLARLEEL